MFTYSVTTEWIAAILDKKFVVESASKKDELTVRLLLKQRWKTEQDFRCA